DFPIGEMRGEDDAAAPGAADVEEALERRLVVSHVGGARMLEIEDAQPVEMGEFGRHAPEIVPDAAEDALDLLRRLVGKSGGEIGAADAVLRQPGSHPAHQRAEQIAQARPIGPAHQPQGADHDRADPGVGQRVETAAARARPAWRLLAHRFASGIQNVMTILPNTCRLSMRSRPRSTSLSGYSLSITGSRPDAIFARLSRILRIEAPNEPMMRYCCWNSCIRLSVVEGPDVAPQVTRR